MITSGKGNRASPRAMRLLIPAMAALLILFTGAALADHDQSETCNGPNCGPIVTGSGDDQVVVSHDAWLNSLHYMYDVPGNYDYSSIYGILTNDGADLVENLGDVVVSGYCHDDAYDYDYRWFASANAAVDTYFSEYAIGIDSGDGDDVVRNREWLSVGNIIDSYGFSYATVIEGFDPYCVGGCEPTSATTHTAGWAYSHGIEAGAGTDTVENLGTINVSAVTGTMSEAYTYAQSGIVGILLDLLQLGVPIPNPTILESESWADATALARGVTSVSDLNNEGLISVGASANAMAQAGTVYYFVDVPTSIPDLIASLIGTAMSSASASADAFAVANAIGVHGDEAGATIRNLEGGEIHVTSTAYAGSYAHIYIAGLGFSIFTPTLTEADSYAMAVSRGVLSVGDGSVLNDGLIVSEASVMSTAYAWEQPTYSWRYGDASAEAVAFAVGVEGGEGANTVVNGEMGAMFVDAEAMATDWWWYTGNERAYAYGIRTLAGDDTIHNLGLMQITADANLLYAVGLAGGPGDDGLFNDGCVSLFTDGSGVVFGISAGSGDDTVRNNGELFVESFGQDILLAGISTGVDFDETPVVTAGEEPGSFFVNLGGSDDVVNQGRIEIDAYGDFTAAFGILGGAGADFSIDFGEFFEGEGELLTIYTGDTHVTNSGDIDVFVGGYDSIAVGILTGLGGDELFDLPFDPDDETTIVRLVSGNDYVANTGRIHVGNDDWYGYGGIAAGIVTGFGAEQLFGLPYNWPDNGWFEIEPGNDIVLNQGTIDVSNYDYYGWGWSVGIMTGDGDDTVINDGTILANLAISTGAGNDDVHLRAFSYTEGDIELGSGDDVLALDMQAELDGWIYGGDGSDAVYLGERSLNEVDGIFGVEDYFLGDGVLTVNSSLDVTSGTTIHTTLTDDYRCGEMEIGGDVWLMPDSGGSTLAQTEVPDVLFGGTLDIDAEVRTYQDGETFDILRASQIYGQFEEVILPDPTAFLDFGVQYASLGESEGIDCVQATVDVATFTSAANNRVQRSVARTLDRLVPRAAGDLSYAIGSFQFATNAQVDRSFQSLSIEPFDAFGRTSLDATRLFEDGIQHRMDVTRIESRLPEVWQPGPTTFGGAKQATPVVFDRQSGIWLTGLSQSGDQDPDPGFTGHDFSMDGVMLGYDIPFGKMMVGLTGGQLDSHFHFDGTLGKGAVATDFGSIYGGYFDERSYVMSMLSYADHDYDTLRNLEIGDLQRTATGKYAGHAVSARLGGGYGFQYPRWRIEPFGMLRYTDLDEGSLRETGADTVNLELQSRRTESLLSDIGVRFAGDFAGEKRRWLPEMLVAWNYDFDLDDRKIVGAFRGAPSDLFSIEGQELNHHGATVGLGLAYEGRAGWSASFRYNAVLRGDYTSHSLVGGFRTMF